MKRLMLVALLMAFFVFPTLSQGAVLFTENFDYAAGVLGDSAGQANVSDGNWHHYSGLGYLIECIDGNLSYPSYSASGIGRKIRIVRHPLNASAEDVYRQFATQTPGVSLYAPFLLKVTSDSMSPDTSTNGEYFAALLTSSSTTLLVGRVSCKMSTIAGKYQIGIRATSSNSTVWHSSELDVNTEYLIVLGYDLVTGNTNDVAKLWVDPVLAGPQPAPLLTQTSALGTDPADIARFAIRQGSSATYKTVTPNADLDGIQVVSSWDGVTGVAGDPLSNLNNFSLMPCTPNPSNRSTKFTFSLSLSGKVDLSVFNVLGQKVATVYSGQMAAGQHSISWNLKGQNGQQLPNGVYFYNLTDGSRSSTRRLLILK